MICPVLITNEENWRVATDINTGIASQGKTMEEAMENLKEALELYYEDVPVPECQNTQVYLTTMEVSL